MTIRKMQWKPASVGCHWFASRETRFGPQHFAISTRTLYINGQPVRTFPESGYALYCNTAELGIFKTLRAAERAAERTPRRKEQRCRFNTTPANRK